MDELQVDLKDRLDSIDEQAILKGKDKMLSLHRIEKQAMWLKGIEIIKDYPEIVKEKERRGRGGATISFESISKIVMRNKSTIKRWVDLVQEAGNTKEEFNIWIEPVLKGIENKWTASVKEIEDKNNPHVSNNSGENEWYTPKPFIDSAREFMGSIDCDPASSELANETVNASMYFTKDDNGLEQKWNGNVWMNPPYSQPEIKEFSYAVSEKYDSGEIKQACVLVNNATETEFFQRMIQSASAICFPRSRIKFIDKEGNPSGAPLQGQAIIYFGDNLNKFIKVFSEHGIMVAICKEG